MTEENKPSFSDVFKNYFEGLPVVAFDLAKAFMPKEGGPQEPDYNISDGAAGVYTMRPLEYRAIQLLPENGPAVAAFMVDNKVSFSSCGKCDREHFAVKLTGGEWVALEAGYWAIVKGVRGEDGFDYDVVQDKLFAAHFQGQHRTEDLLGKDVSTDPSPDTSDSAQGRMMGRNPSHHEKPLLVKKYGFSGMREDDPADYEIEDFGKSDD